MATITLDPEQTRNAQAIVQVGREIGATDAEIQAAIATGLMESGLHTGSTGDGGNAVGIFQQWPSYGTEQQRRDPFTAARAFLSRLIGTRSSNLPVDVRVGNVQRPAGWSTNPADQARTGDRYEALFPEADQVLHALGYNRGPGSADSLERTQPSATTPSADPSSSGGGLGGVGGSMSAPGILKGLDDVLNSGGLTDPGGTARTIIARGGLAVAGVTVSVFGLILVVSAVGKKSGATAIAEMVPGVGGVAASAADAVGG